MAALFLTAGFSAPAFAVSCSEYLAMNPEAQADARGAMVSDSDLDSDDPVAADALVALVRNACESHMEMDMEEAMAMMK